MGNVRTRPSGMLIAFPAEAARPVRASLGEDEPRGAILLFTGIRYERMQPNPGPAQASDGQAKRRRRR